MPLGVAFLRKKRYNRTDIGHISLEGKFQHGAAAGGAKEVLLTDKGQPGRFVYLLTAMNGLKRHGICKGDDSNEFYKPDQRDRRRLYRAAGSGTRFHQRLAGVAVDFCKSVLFSYII